MEIDAKKFEDIRLGDKFYVVKRHGTPELIQEWVIYGVKNFDHEALQLIQKKRIMARNETDGKVFGAMEGNDKIFFCLSQHSNLIGATEKIFLIEYMIEKVKEQIKEYEKEELELHKRMLDKKAVIQELKAKKGELWRQIKPPEEEDDNDIDDLPF
jgi:hypothetical protein